MVQLIIVKIWMAAALIEACDLVVSTSNVTIHLAGALGKDTWVLLPLFPLLVAT